MTDQDEEDALRFRIGMRVTHPTLDLAPVLAPLGIIPMHSKVAGAARVGVKGQSLPGTYRFSFWNWSRQIKGDRDFAAAALRLAETLAPHRELFQTLKGSGGSVAISLALIGSNNIDATLFVRDMARLADLGIDLDIEVFPHMSDYD